MNSFTFHLSGGVRVTINRNRDGSVVVAALVGEVVHGETTLSPTQWDLAIDLFVKARDGSISIDGACRGSDVAISWADQRKE